MKTLRCLLLACLFALPAAHAAKSPEIVGACATGCMTEKDHCVAKLGQLSEDNCAQGMRLCIERCNPRRQNTPALDAAEERKRYGQIKGLDTQVDVKVRACTQRCEVSSTLCPRDGHTSNECSLGRQACIDRCYGK